MAFRRHLQRVPPWANREEIKCFYADCPEGYEVDHIVPIIAKRDGEHVACGLHCESNLRYVTPRENKEKGARLIQELVTVTLSQGSTAT